MYTNVIYNSVWQKEKSKKHDITPLTAREDHRLQSGRIAEERTSPAESESSRSHPTLRLLQEVVGTDGHIHGQLQQAPGPHVLEEPFDATFQGVCGNLRHLIQFPQGHVGVLYDW